MKKIDGFTEIQTGNYTIHFDGPYVAESIEVISYLSKKNNELEKDNKLLKEENRNLKSYLGQDELPILNKEKEEKSYEEQRNKFMKRSDQIFENMRPIKGAQPLNERKE